MVHPMKVRKTSREHSRKHQCLERAAHSVQLPCLWSVPTGARQAEEGGLFLFSILTGSAGGSRWAQLHPLQIEALIRSTTAEQGPFTANWNPDMPWLPHPRVSRRFRGVKSFFLPQSNRLLFYRSPFYLCVGHNSALLVHIF